MGDTPDQGSLRGTKRSPTTPLTPSLARSNVQRRKFDKPIALVAEPVAPVACEPESSTVYEDTGTPVSEDMLRKYEENWILRKKNAELKELVEFLEVERSLGN